MNYQAKLEEFLISYFSELSHFGELHEATKYMSLGQGKRIRPILLLSAANDLEVLSEDSYFVAAALELLHTSTLIHDDLPALDNDDYRRGKSSCHRKFSESTAVLVGDLIFSLGNSLILKSAYSENQKTRYLDSFNRTFQNICYGQVLDLAEGSQRDFQKINYYKTASLFECVFEFLFIMTDKNRNGVDKNSKENGLKENYINLGHKIGQLFQIINDYLDQFANPRELGRIEASDQVNGKETIVSKLSIGEAEALLSEEYQEVLMALQKVEEESSQHLDELKLVIFNLWSKTEQQVQQVAR